MFGFDLLLLLLLWFEQSLLSVTVETAALCLYCPCVWAAVCSCITVHWWASGSWRRLKGCIALDEDSFLEMPVPGVSCGLFLASFSLVLRNMSQQKCNSKIKNSKTVSHMQFCKNCVSLLSSLASWQKQWISTSRNISWLLPYKYNED